jgi:uncharacterized protein (DUF433 family)
MILAETQTVPLKVDSSGVIRVGGTRVTLDTVIYTFNEGNPPEEIIDRYPTLNLADVYAVIAYYLNNRDTIDDYLREREEAAAKLRAEIEARPEYQNLRERLLAGRAQQQKSL